MPSSAFFLYNWNLTVDLSSLGHFSITGEENACIAMVKCNSLYIFNNQENQGHFFFISVSFTLWMIHDYA